MKKIVLLLLVLTLTVACLCPAAAAEQADYGVSGKIVNILLIGVDEKDQMADAMLLFTLNKESETLTLTSFLRDSYVDLPDYRGHVCGWNRLNTAYALGNTWAGIDGGIEMLDITLKDNFGVEVDGNVVVNFDSFCKIVDRVGGIEVTLDADQLAYMNKATDRTLEEGVNLLNGTEALEYIRMRRSNPTDSDMQRGERQRAVVQQILTKLGSLSIPELAALVFDVLPLCSTDIDAMQFAVYLYECLPLIPGVEIVTQQCPKDGTYWGEMKDFGGTMAAVLVLDIAENQAMMIATCEE